jgi:hypothetical protein
MAIWQTYFLLVFAATSIALSAKGFYESHKKKNAFGNVHTFVLGAYVWGDAFVFGIFWAFVSVVSLAFQDWILFWLVASLFWVVRSFGEMVYWLNEQHANKKRVNIKKKMLYKYFHNDSVLFIYQTTQQCILVVSIVASIYFASVWLKQF